MKVSVSLSLVVVVGALGWALVTALGLEPTQYVSALVGVGFSTALGMLVLAVKATLVGRTSGLRDLKVQLASMGASFGLRLFGLGAGVLLLRRYSLPLDGFLVSFVACYFAQQVIEVRYVLRAALVAPVAASPEVGR